MRPAEYSSAMDWTPTRPTHSLRASQTLRKSTLFQPLHPYESPTIRRYKQERADLQVIKYYDSPNRPIRVRRPRECDLSSLTRKRKRLYVERRLHTPVQDEVQRREQEHREKQKKEDEGDVLLTKALQASPFKNDTEEEEEEDEDLVDDSRNKRQRTTPPSDDSEEMETTFGRALKEAAQLTVVSMCSLPLLAVAGVRRGLNALFGRQVDEQLPIDDLWWKQSQDLKLEEPSAVSQAAFDSGVELASVPSAASSVSAEQSSVGNADDQVPAVPDVLANAQDAADAQVTPDGSHTDTPYQETPIHGQSVAGPVVIDTPHMEYSVEQEDLGLIMEKVESGVGQLQVEKIRGMKVITSTPMREPRKLRISRQLFSIGYQRREEEREREREREEERRKIIAEQEKRKQERLALEKARREADEMKRLARVIPKELVIQPLSSEWESRINALMKKGHGATLARTSAGVEIKLQSFQTLLPKRGDLGWLDDEIINGYMQAIVDFGNGDAVPDGQKRSVIKRNTPPKYHTFNSFFYENLSNKGPASIARWSKRAKIDSEKLLQVEFVFIPLHLGNHWTLAVVSGTKRTIEYFDSLGGHPGQHVAHIKAWLKAELGQKWNEEDWKVLPTKGPRQQNGYDCGVFTVTTAKCIMLGVDPLAYSQEDISNQRMRMVAELCRGGFVDEFTPPWPPGGAK